jgi:uncharacterized cupin superfamily protein
MSEVGGDLFTYKGTAGEGIDSLFFELVCPPGGGPPPHTDPSEELYYVVAGEFEFRDASPDGGAVRAGPGDSFVIPKRAPHTYRNVGSSDGRMIVFFRDNEHMQPFFDELGQPVADAASWVSSGPPSLEKALPAAKRHGIEPVFSSDEAQPR